MATRHCFSAAILIIGIALLPGCNIGDSGDETGKTCVTKPAKWGDAPFEYDVADTSFGYAVVSGNGDVEFDEYYFYDSAEDFLLEPESLGLTTWTRRKAYDSMCCTWNYVREYDEGGRVTMQVMDVNDVVEVHEETGFDSWDSLGRPLRGFAQYSEDDGSYACSNIMIEYEYEIESDAIVARYHTGVDQDGADCGNARTVRTTYMFFPYVMLKRERWEGASADVDSEDPQSVYENESANPETRKICL